MNDREKTSIRTVAGHPPLREVVCAVNFSLASAAAARTAMGLVQAARGRLTLLHVMEPNPHQQMVLSGGEALRYLNEYEARAAMACAHPMFERAGMRRYDCGDGAAYFWRDLSSCVAMQRRPRNDHER